MLNLQLYKVDLGQIRGTMEDSVLEYGAGLQDIHVHAIPDAGFKVSGTSDDATRLEGYVVVAGGRRRLQIGEAARAESMAAALTALFEQCQRDVSFSEDVLGAVVLRVLATPSVMQRVLYSPPPAPLPPSRPPKLSASPLPPAAASPLQPPRPPLPLSVKAVVLTMTASGVVSDYADTSSLQRKFADTANVDTSAVTITVASASVIITATIAVPASSTAASVSIALLQTFGSASAASEKLGITIESAPSVDVVDILPPPGSPPPQIEEEDGVVFPTAEKGASLVTQVGIAVLVVAVVLLVGVCAAIKVKRQRIDQGRRTYLRGGGDDISGHGPEHEMIGSSTRGMKQSSSGLGHMDVEVSMDVGAKGADKGYDDNVSPDPYGETHALPEDDERNSGKYNERIQRARSHKTMNSRSPTPSPQDPRLHADRYDLPLEIGGGNVMRLETGSAENSPRPNPDNAHGTAAPSYRAAPVLLAGSAHAANGAGEVNLLHDEWMASLVAPAPPTQGVGGARAQLDDDDPFESAGHLRL